MPDKRIGEHPREDAAEVARRIEQLIVLLLLDEDHPPQWSTRELQARLPEVAAEQLDAALLNLQGEEVVCREGERWLASLAARRIDELGLIGG